jgi:hypothetical protein
MGYASLYVQKLHSEALLKREPARENNLHDEEGNVQRWAAQQQHAPRSTGKRLPENGMLTGHLSDFPRDFRNDWARNEGSEEEEDLGDGRSRRESDVASDKYERTMRKENRRRRKEAEDRRLAEEHAEWARQQQALEQRKRELEKQRMNLASKQSARSTASKDSRNETRSDLIHAHKITPPPGKTQRETHTEEDKASAEAALRRMRAETRRRQEKAAEQAQKLADEEANRQKSLLEERKASLRRDYENLRKHAGELVNHHAPLARGVFRLGENAAVETGKLGHGDKSKSHSNNNRQPSPHSAREHRHASRHHDVDHDPRMHSAAVVNQALFQRADARSEESRMPKPTAISKPWRGAHAPQTDTTSERSTYMPSSSKGMVARIRSRTAGACRDDAGIHIYILALHACMHIHVGYDPALLELAGTMQVSTYTYLHYMHRCIYT